MSTAQIYNKAQSDTLLADKVSKTATGTQSIASGLAVGGVITQGTYELDQDITISNLPTGINCSYAHIRISNGKLNIVLAFWRPAQTAVSATTFTEIGSIALSSSVLSHLYPAYRTVLSTDTKTGEFPSTYGTCYMGIEIQKSTSFLVIGFVCDAQTILTSFENNWRFEFNYILS